LSIETILRSVLSIDFGTSVIFLVNHTPDSVICQEFPNIFRDENPCKSAKTPGYTPEFLFFH